ncbi:MAG: glycine cleavage system protein H [Pseudonocardiaceae bacterium]
MLDSAIVRSPELSLLRQGKAAMIPAQNQLGDIESTKSTSDLVAPVNGEVVAMNIELADRPELVNAEPYARGWMLDRAGLSVGHRLMAPSSAHDHRNRRQP